MAWTAIAAISGSRAITQLSHADEDRVEEKLTGICHADMKEHIPLLDFSDAVAVELLRFLVSGRRGRVLPS